jgi:hypothetical protein
MYALDAMSALARSLVGLSMRVLWRVSGVGSQPFSAPVLPAYGAGEAGAGRAPDQV